MSVDDKPVEGGVRPFDETAIRATVARYHREYDRYLKLCARVAEICRLEIVEGNAIRAQVTSRAKTPKSLESKLRRIVAANKKPLTDIDSVFLHVRDLAAVRIATYEHRHEAQVVDLVCKRFVAEAGGACSAEAKDYLKDKPNQDNYYRATHVEVFLPTTDLVGTYANVAGVPCEIQVCSMMAHVWNEIEHDLGYKPFSGSLSQFERDQLRHLGMNVRMADGIISQLLAETDRRQAAQTAPFTDVYDFVARVRPWFPGIDFGRHAGPLFDALRPFRLLTVDSLRKAIDLPDPIADGAAKRLVQLRDLGAKAVAGGSPTAALAQLDESSSDLLLVGLLPRLARFLAPDGTTPTPSDSRIRRIADDYLTFMRIAATLPPPASDA